MSRARLGGLARLKVVARMTLRSLARDKRRTALLVALVALPAVATMALATIVSARTPTVDERLAHELGGTQAWIIPMRPDGYPVADTPDGYPEDVPVFGNDAPPTGPYANPASILPQGTEIVPVDLAAVVVISGSGAVDAGTVAGDVWGPRFAGLYGIVAGRAPERVGEVMLNPDAARDLGVSIGDTVTLGKAGPGATVVGLVDGEGRDRPYIVVGPQGGTGTPTWEETPENVTRLWYVTDLPITPDLEAELNSHGLGVYSRAAVREATAGIGTWQRMGDSIGEVFSDGGVLAMAALGVLEALLLAGAAFAVTMRAQQRELALLASTGAHRRVIVSVGVISGAWVGLVAGVIGIPVGMAVGFAWNGYQRSLADAAISRVWGNHVEPAHMVLVLAFTTFVGAVSAIIPARAASRFDVVATLRGAAAPYVPNRRRAIAGAVIAAASVVLFVMAGVLRSRGWFVTSDDVRAAWMSKAVAAAVAAMLLALLAAGVGLPGLMGRLAGPLGRLGVGAKLAARDAARNSARSVPVVLAMAITFVAVAVLGLEADRQLHADDSTGFIRAGDGWVSLEHYEDDGGITFDDAGPVVDAVESTDPVVTASPITLIDPNGTNGWIYGLTPLRENVCPEELGVTMTEAQRARDERCTGQVVSWIGSAIMVVDPAAERDTLTALVPDANTDEVVDALSQGRVVVLSKGMVRGTTANFASWDLKAEGQPTSAVPPTTTRELEALELSDTRPRMETVQAIVSTQTAQALGAPMVTTGVWLHADQPISRGQEARISGTLLALTERTGAFMHGDSGVGVGYALYALVGASVVSIVTVALALALARQDGRRDEATLTAVGASPRVVRAWAGWHAALLVLVSEVVGGAMGLGFAWVFQRNPGTGTLSVPWLAFAIVAVTLPAVIGIGAALVSRPMRHPRFALAA